MISRGFIREVLSRTNLIELAEEFGAKGMRKAGDGIWMGRCPNPDHDDSTPSFCVHYRESDNDWTWQCFGCHTGPKDEEHGNYGSDAIAFVRWMSAHTGDRTPMSFIEAVNFLAKRIGLKVEEDKYAAEKKQEGLRARAYHEAISPAARDYLIERGLRDKDINEWLIGSIECRERCGSVTRITFPLLNRQNEVIGFSARKMPNAPDDAPKYINSKSSEWFDKGSYLYGINHIDRGFGEIRITEGAMDVIVARRWGARNIVCTLGTSFTRKHAEIIRSMGLTPCLCMDSDEAGRKAAERAAKILSDIGVHSKVFFIPNAKDMADMSNMMRDDTEEYIGSRSMQYWQYLLKEPEEIFRNRIEELRASVLPKILEAEKGASTPETKLLMKSYVKERFGINL